MLKENQLVNVIVRAIVIEEGELVVTEWRDQSVSFLLGGRVDYGEHLLDSLHREMREEADVAITVSKLAYFSENVFTAGNGREYHEYGYYFLVQPERPICPQGPIPNPDSSQLIIRRAPLTAVGLANTWPRFLAHYLPQDVANRFAAAPRFLFNRDRPDGQNQSYESTDLAALFRA